MKIKSPSQPQIFIAKNPNSTNEIPFSEVYEVLTWAAYPRVSDDPHRIELGTRANRKCAFCGETEKQKKFSQIKDAIPAGLGNRRYFSNEECDECNERFGKLSENELLRFLLPQRALTGVKRRPGEPNPKFKSPSGKSYIQVKNGICRFVVGPDDDTISVTRTENSIGIKMEQPPFKPISAIKSLLRSAWMLLDKDERDRHRILLNIINDKIRLSAHQLLSIAVPGAGYASTSLIVWEKIHPSSSFPRLLISLTVGDTVLFWGEPNEDTLTHLPLLIPPIVGLSDKNTLPYAEERSWTTDDPIKLTFSYNIYGDIKKVETTKEPAALEELPTETHAPLNNTAPLQVRLDFKSKDGTLSNFTEGALRIMGRDFYSSYFSLEDHGLPGFLHLQYPLNSKHYGKPYFGLDFSVLPAHETEVKMSALVEAANAGKSICIIDKSSGQQLLDLSIYAYKSDTEDPHRENLGFLSLINKEFGISAKLPKQTGEHLAHRLSFLGKGIRFGAWSEKIEGKGVEFGYLKKEDALNILHYVKEGKAFELKFTATSEFSGNPVETQAIIQVNEVLIDEHFSKQEIAIKKAPDGSKVKIRFKTGNVTFVFPQWYQAHTSNESEEV